MNESPLERSKDSWRRKLANLLIKIPKVGMKLHDLLHTKAELDELEAFGRAFAEDIKLHKRIHDHIAANYPDAAKWFTEEKYRLILPEGGDLVVEDSISIFGQLINPETVGQFYSEYVVTDEIYKATVMFFFQLPDFLKRRGLIDEWGVIKNEDHSILNQLFINEVTTMLAMVDPERYQWDELHPRMKELFKD